MNSKLLNTIVFIVGIFIFSSCVSTENTQVEDTLPGERMPQVLTVYQVNF